MLYVLSSVGALGSIGSVPFPAGCNSAPAIREAGTLPGFRWDVPSTAAGGTHHVNVGNVEEGTTLH